MKVIFDHNLSPRLARALHAFFSGEHEIISLRDRFDSSIKDVDLIRALSSEGNWVFVSGDRRITRNKAEREAFRNSRLIGLFMSSGLYKAREIKKLERLLALWETIEKAVSIVQPGAMFELPMKAVQLKQIKL
ncbi:MAG: hypothetical protein AB7S92_23920 [Parvibaculaceae bacterium]